MWLGEQITDKGIGNGVSLIIFIGIVLRYPTYVAQTVQLGQKDGLNVLGLVLFIAIALLTIISIIFMYQGQRRIPVQQARRVVGPQDVRGPLVVHSAAPQQLRASSRSSSRSRSCCCRSRRSRGSSIPPAPAYAHFGHRGPDQHGRGLARLADLLQPEQLALQPGLLRPGRDLHVLL
jgi:hypothetical protein